MPTAPPRPRRWTPQGGAGSVRCLGSSAPAEMDPPPIHTPKPLPWLLRARGDGPSSPKMSGNRDTAPPRPRRWTRRGEGHVRRPDGSSAPAEMDPGIDGPRCAEHRLLRARGDGPHAAILLFSAARAPPRPRRWTCGTSHHMPLRTGSSAPAEMDPYLYGQIGVPQGLLRARGDGPAARMFGVSAMAAPPRPRRWTLAQEIAGRGGDGSSAPAEMDPIDALAMRDWQRLLRARGDGPDPHLPVASLSGAPPRPRRWTCDGLIHVEPLAGSSAPAEMDPRLAPPASGSARLLRARGDGPPKTLRKLTLTWAPPRPRRWTRPAAADRPRRRGSSAPAEMDPRPQ